MYFVFIIYTTCFFKTLRLLMKSKVDFPDALRDDVCSSLKMLFVLLSIDES